MTRQGGWLKQAPVPKPLTRLRFDPIGEAEQHSRELNARIAHRLQRNAHLRKRAILDAACFHTLNIATQQDKMILRRERRAEMLQKIAQAEAKHNRKEAEALRWHLDTFLKDE